MRWTVHGERSLYESEWVRLQMVDVEVPDMRRFDHHVVRIPNPGAGVVVFEKDRGVLLMWRHRFITDAWGWEMPAGKVDPGETPEEAAARETLEETGWRPGPLRHLTTYHPMNGISDGAFHLFVADGATYVGDPEDPSESSKLEWVPLDRVRELITTGQVRDGMSLTALLYVLAFEQEYL